MRNLFQADTAGQTPEADEDGEEAELRVTVFPESGASPYVRDVTVQPDGTFELDPEDGRSYKVSMGSVWTEGGVDRAFVLEHAPATVCPAQIAGDDVLSAEDLHAVARNNLWMQLDEVSQRDNPWTNARAWAAVAGFAVLCLLLFWQIKTMGDGFEQLADAIRGAQLSAPSGGSGHQDIAPGGT